MTDDDAMSKEFLHRSEIEQEAIRTRMMELFTQGFNRKYIQESAKKEFGIEIRQFERYWAGAIRCETRKIQAEKEELLVAFVRHSMRRVQFATAKSEDIKWFREAHNVETDLFDKLQSMGMFPKNADKIDLSITNQVSGAEAFVQAFKEYDKRKKESAEKAAKEAAEKEAAAKAEAEKDKGGNEHVEPGAPAISPAGSP